MWQTTAVLVGEARLSILGVNSKRQYATATTPETYSIGIHAVIARGDPASRFFPLDGLATCPRNSKTKGWTSNSIGLSSVQMTDHSSSVLLSAIEHDLQSSFFGCILKRVVCFFYFIHVKRMGNELPGL